MALNLGSDFNQRWLNTPVAVRQTFLQDLERAREILTPQSDTKIWIQQDLVAQSKNQQIIDQAYAELKAQMVEAERLRIQLALNQKLDEQRQVQQNYAQALLQDEQQQFSSQTEQLQRLNHHLQQDVQMYLSRYRKNPTQQHPFAVKVHVMNSQHLSDVENIKLRLEIEAENLIIDKLSAIKQQLELAAQEEIAYLLQHIVEKEHSIPETIADPE